MTPRPDPPPRLGVLQRARGHLMDLTPLKVSREFRLLFFGHSVSNFGDEIVAVAIPYQVFKITGSTLAVGLLGLAALIPVFVFPIIGGTVADAVERRRLVTVTHVLLAALSGLMAINALLPHPLLWPMYVFTFVAAGLYTFNRPALDTWPARLLDKELLPSSNALDAGFGTFAGMLGPVAAGFLLVAIAAGRRLRVRRRHVPRCDRGVPVDAPVAARRRGERGQLGGGQGWVPLLEGQAERPVGVPRGPERDDLRVPDGPLAGGGAASRRWRRGGAGALPRVPLRGAGRGRVHRHVALRPSEGRSSAGKGDHAVDRGVGRRDRPVRSLARALAVAAHAGDRRGRRHGERHLPDLDHPGRGRGSIPGAFGGHRHGGVGHRAVTRRRRVRRGRDPHDPRDLDRVRAGSSRSSGSACFGGSHPGSGGTTPATPRRRRLPPAGDLR